MIQQLRNIIKINLPLKKSLTKRKILYTKNNHMSSIKFILNNLF